MAIGKIYKLNFSQNSHYTRMVNYFNTTDKFFNLNLKKFVLISRIITVSITEKIDAFVIESA